MAFTMNVISDHWSGSIVDDYSTGYQLNRVFVCQITNMGTTTPDAVHEAVLGYSGIPVKGTAHPSDANLILYRKSLTAKNDGKTFTISCQYARQINQVVPSTSVKPQYEFSQSLVSVQTNKDISGTLLTVGYTSGSSGAAATFQGKSFTTATSGADVVCDSITATATVYRPQQIITCTRLESSNPNSLQDTYGGFVNSDSFTICGVAYAVKTILCRGISGTTADGGNSWTVKYIFEKKSTTWLQTEFAWNYQGVVPSDVSVGNGISKYDLYPTVAMNSLNM